MLRSLVTCALRLPMHVPRRACRFANCQACADYGDHDRCVHGAMASPHFKARMANPEEAAIHVLHDGSWGGWGFNVKKQVRRTLFSGLVP